MIDFEVIIFYRLENLTDLVFHETIPVCCGTRVNAKKYAKEDFLDKLNDLCPDLKSIILDVRIKSEMTNQSIIEHENYLANLELEKDKENLRILLQIIGPAKTIRGKAIREIFNKYEIDRCSKLFNFDSNQLLKDIKQKDGIGSGTINTLKNVIETGKLEYYVKGNSFYNGNSHGRGKDYLKIIH